MSRGRQTMSGFGVKTVGTGAGVVLLWLVLVAANILVSGWILMLLIGAVHGSIWESVPALGYGPSILLAAIISLIVGMFSRR